MSGFTNRAAALRAFQDYRTGEAWTDERHKEELANINEGIAEILARLNGLPTPPIERTEG